jgi:hypothetical protein
MMVCHTIQGRNPLYTSCQKDYKNIAYKSDSAVDNQWRPAFSEIENEVNLDDGSLVKATHLTSKTFRGTESFENLLYDKSTVTTV